MSDLRVRHSGSRRCTAQTSPNPLPRIVLPPNALDLRSPRLLALSICDWLGMLRIRSWLDSNRAQKKQMHKTRSPHKTLKATKAPRNPRKFHNSPVSHVRHHSAPALLLARESPERVEPL